MSERARVARWAPGALDKVMARLLELEELPIRVTSRGEWLHGDRPLHPRVRELFQKNVVPRADGSYLVKLGPAEQVLEVDDTAYFVTRLTTALGADGRLAAVRLWISDGACEALDGATLMQSPDNVLYCRLRRHGLSVPCRFTPAQYHELALHAEEAAAGMRLAMGEVDFGFAPYDPRPVPA